MQIADFELERYFARWEFSARHLLCASDVESWELQQLLAVADESSRSLWQELRLGYTESTGHPLLRAEIAAMYESVAPDETLTFTGAEEAIFLVMHALLEAGDHAVVAWPAYQSLFEVARSVGAEVALVPLDPADWSLDPERVRAAMRPNTRVVVVNFPHSPTGALPDAGILRRLLEITEEHGVLLFSDEVYRYLEFDASERWPAAVDRGSRTLSLGVLSKAFALAGLRVGWVATHDRALLEKIVRLKDYTTICGSAPSEILAIMALRARDRVLARSRGIIAANVPLLDGFFARMSHRFAWVRPRASSVGFPRLLADEPGAIDRFAEQLVDAEGVLLLPASRFGYTGNHFRIGFGRQDMPVALEKLENFARQMFG
jgi:aspartate/methionine/tyrosine aminotransferase